MRDGAEWWLGHGDRRLGSIAGAIAVRIVLTSNGQAEVYCATSASAPEPTRSWRRSQPEMLGLPLDNVTIKWRPRPCAIAGSKADHGLQPSVSERDVPTADAVREDTRCVWHGPRMRIRRFETREAGTM